MKIHLILGLRTVHPVVQIPELLKEYEGVLKMCCLPFIPPGCGKK
jgi:hypothetical protein